MAGDHRVLKEVWAGFLVLKQVVEAVSLVLNWAGRAEGRVLEAGVSEEAPDEHPALRDLKSKPMVALPTVAQAITVLVVLKLVEGASEGSCCTRQWVGELSDDVAADDWQSLQQSLQQREEGEISEVLQWSRNQCGKNEVVELYTSLLQTFLNNNTYVYT